MQVPVSIYLVKGKGYYMDRAKAKSVAANHNTYAAPVSISSKQYKEMVKRGEIK